MPEKFPLPAGATVGSVVRTAGEIDGTVMVTDPAQAVAFWKAALPKAGYRVLSVDTSGGVGEIRFAGHGCVGDSQIAVVGNQAQVQCDTG